jgi:hypothetical protein
MKRWFSTKKPPVVLPPEAGGASLAGTTDASSPYSTDPVAEADAAVTKALESSGGGSVPMQPLSYSGVDTPAVGASSPVSTPPGSPAPAVLDSVYGPAPTALPGSSSTSSLVGGAPASPGTPAGPGLPPMDALSPYTQQLIKDHKAGIAVGAAGAAASKNDLPVDYASNPLDKVKQLRPGTKRKVLFGSLSFIFLLAGIVGVVVSWFYA